MLMCHPRDAQCSKLTSHGSQSPHHKKGINPTYLSILTDYEKIHLNPLKTAECSSGINSHYGERSLHHWARRKR